MYHHHLMDVLVSCIRLRILSLLHRTTVSLRLHGVTVLAARPLTGRRMRSPHLMIAAMKSRVHPLMVVRCTQPLFPSQHARMTMLDVLHCSLMRVHPRILAQMTHATIHAHFLHIPLIHVQIHGHCCQPVLRHTMHARRQHTSRRLVDHMTPALNLATLWITGCRLMMYVVELVTLLKCVLNSDRLQRRTILALPLSLEALTQHLHDLAITRRTHPLDTHRSTSSHHRKRLLNRLVASIVRSIHQRHLQRSLAPLRANMTCHPRAKPRWCH